MLENLIDTLKEKGFLAYSDKDFLKSLRKFIRTVDDATAILNDSGVLYEIPNKKQLEHLTTQLNSLIIYYRTERSLNITAADFAFTQTRNALAQLEEEHPTQHEALLKTAKLRLNITNDEPIETTEQALNDTEAPKQRASTPKPSSTARKRKTTKSILRFVKDPIWKSNYLLFKEHMNVDGDLTSLTLKSEPNTIWLYRQNEMYKNDLLSENQILLLRKIGLLS